MDKRAWTCAVWLLACRPSGDESTVGKSSTTIDVTAATEGDPWNCGELGLKCVGPLAIGECIDGECGPHLSDCMAGQSCENACATYGEVCVERGCEGATAFAFMAGTQAEADARCGEAMRVDAVGVEVTCGEVLPLGQATTWRCCCDQ